MKKILFGLFVGSAALLSSCGGGEETVKQYDYDRADSLSVDYTRQALAIRGNIKETSGFYTLLNGKGAEFNSSLANSPGSASKYSSSFDKSVNMGIYGADLNYLTSYEQIEGARSTVEAISKLATSLGIEKAFDKETFEAILEPQDSNQVETKSNLITKAFRKAEDQMYSEDRALMGTLMVAGGWIESTYITSSLIASSEIPGNELSDYWILVFNYESVMKMLNVFGDDADAKKMRDMLQSIEENVKAITDQTKLNMKDVEAMKEATGKLRSGLI